MGVTNSNKFLSTNTTECNGTFQVTLSLTAAPNITTNPTDIVLVLDRSRSMSGSPLANLKNGAKKFIQIIDEATDNAQDGQIGGGSRIGIVSFASTATQDTQLITSVADLDAAVNALSAGGQTNHADAFTKALQLFDASSTNDKVIVLFTDGNTTTGGNPATVAAAAKAQGVIIYCIGLSGSNGIDEQALEDWASSPAASYVVITPDDTELEDLFADLAQNISKPGATDIVIRDTVSPCFQILSVSNPTKGTTSILDATTLQWNIDKLGVTASEGASLTFTVQHVGPCTGTVEVNADISYSDNSGNIVTFPSPTIDVVCDNVVQIEPCPTPVSVTIGGCEDSIEYNAGEIILESLGRILQLDVTLRRVCPNRRVALAVILTELDSMDNEHKRGLKTVLVPAHARSTCTDVTVRCIKFVLPESLDASGTTDGICDQRRFRARFIANYVDYDYECCNTVTCTT